jgi:hypothetical protein
VVAAVVAAAVVVVDGGGNAMTTAKHIDRHEASMNTIRILATAFAAGILAFGATPAGAADAPAKPAAQTKKLPAQAAYASPEEAGRALYDAMKGDDLRRIYSVLGPGSGKVIYTSDAVADNAMRDLFVAAFDKSARYERDGDARATLVIGAKDYPFPFPLVKGAQGWRFDARAGAEEIVNRRIGENELAAINVCLAYVDAQREYVLKDRTASGLLEYAQKFVSAEAKRDGLYWKTREGEPLSPLGPLAATAARKGYTSGSSAYHGYQYKILTAQGKDAPGGAYDYKVKGRMIGGFALVAYPARWDVSGVMSFICNYDGVVYQKNLGKDTAVIAVNMTTYNPDSTWAKAQP